MTSNIGSDIIMNKLSEDTPLKKGDEGNSKNDLINLEKDIMPLLQTHFRPEFLNRLDDIILFNPVNEEMLTKIVDIQLGKIVDLIKAEKNIELIISNEVKKYIAKVGLDPIFGARPLNRAIQNTLLDELAMSIINGDIKDNSRVNVKLDNNKIKFALI